MVKIGLKPLSEFFVDKNNEIIFITEFIDDERESLIDMYLDFDKNRRCCGLPPVKRNEIEKWLDYLIEHGYMFIAKHKDKVIGHVAAIPEKDHAEIAIFIHQDYEGKWIGTELIRFMEESLKKIGIRKLLAVTEESNRDSVKMHLALGFKVKEKGGGLITLERDLN